MKKTVLFLTIMLVTATLALADWDVDEGFETSVPPTDWTETDVSGTSGDWLQHNDTNEPSGGGVHGGTYLAYFNSYDCSAGNSTRLETPPLDFTGKNNVRVTFWMYHDTGYDTDNDRVQIQVNDGTKAWTDVGTAISRYDGSTGWKVHTVDLSAYDGQSPIWVGFLGISGYGNDCHIDDVKIGEPPTVPIIDLSDETHDFDEIKVGSSVNWDVTIYNTGGANLNVTGSTVSAPFSCSYTGTIAPSGSAPATITFHPTSAGYYSATLTFHSNATSVDSTIDLTGYACPFAESFTGTTFPPEKWTVYNLNSGNQWSRYTDYYNSSPACARCYNDINNDDWLITPKLVCAAGTNDTLKFYVRTHSGYRDEHFKVRLSTTTTDTSAFTTTLMDIVWPTNTTWEQVVIGLDDYDGNNVYIAWQYLGTLDFGLALDDICGPQEWLASDDVGVTSIDNPTNGSSIGWNPLTVQCTVENFGSATQSFTVYCKVDLDGGDFSSPIYSDTETVTNLAYQATQQVSFFPQFDPPDVNQSLDMICYTDLAGDEVASNDTTTIDFDVWDVIQTYPILICYENNENRDSLKVALDAAIAYGTIPGYDECDRDDGTPDLTKWETIVYSEIYSVTNDEATTLMNFLDASTESAEKTLIIGGDDIGDYVGTGTGGTDPDEIFYHNYLFAEYLADDGQGDSGNHPIKGVGINPGIIDSIDSSYPDEIAAIPPADTAYVFWGACDASGSACAIYANIMDGYWNIVYFSMEWHEITADINQVFNGPTGSEGIFGYVSGAGGTLPVVLSIFTAQFLNNVPTLYWRTESETDNIGWYIYRNTEEDFSNAEEISGLIEGYSTTTEQHSYFFEDKCEELEPGQQYWYWLESIDLGGAIHHYNKVATLVVSENYDPNDTPEFPVKYGLYQNFPNPFNPGVISRTDVFFCLHESAVVEINVYNILGRFVKCIHKGYTVFDDSKPTPELAYWDGCDENGTPQAQGIYFYRIRVDGKDKEIKKLILLR